MRPRKPVAPLRVAKAGRRACQLHRPALTTRLDCRGLLTWLAVRRIYSSRAEYPAALRVRIRGIEATSLSRTIAQLDTLSQCSVLLQSVIAFLASVSLV